LWRLNISPFHEVTRSLVKEKRCPSMACQGVRLWGELRQRKKLKRGQKEEEEEEEEVSTEIAQKNGKE
jgi:hypothetical protein